MLSTRVRKYQPRGFTLVELLVVMTIIGILMGLIMAAVVNARVAAQKIQCTNNQKEIANAIIMFDSAKQHLPYLDRAKGSTYAWRAQILEQLGEGRLREAYDNASNELTTTNTPRVFRCPSSDHSATEASFYANCGEKGQGGSVAVNAPVDQTSKGLFFKYQKGGYKSSIAKIIDGATQTILISESLKSIKDSSNSVKTLSSNINWSRGDDWKNTGLAWNTSGSNNLDESAARCYPASRHANSHVAAYADGSVRNLNRSLNYNLYKCLMAPNDTGANLKWVNDANYE